MRTYAENVFEEETNWECVGYATADGLWKLDDVDPWVHKDFKYRWKPIDCGMKASFLCQYNPGKMVLYYV